MPTDLGQPFQITWRGDPPQMLSPDIPLWHKFLDLYASNFERFYYEVKVGGPDMSKVDASEEMKRQWYASTAKRPDAIGEKKDSLWIIEVASSPYLRAVGQCLSYKYLWEQDPKINKPSTMVLVCYFIDSDLRQILTHYKVTIITIPNPPQPPK